MNSSDSYDNKTLTKLVRMLSVDLHALKRRLDAIDQPPPLRRRTRQRGPMCQEPVKDLFIRDTD